MINVGKGKFANHCIAPVVFGRASLALIGAGQLPVQAMILGALFGDFHIERTTQYTWMSMITYGYRVLLGMRKIFLTSHTKNTHLMNLQS